MSMYMYLGCQIYGLSFLFCRAAAAVPGLCASKVGSGSLRGGLVPSFVGVSL